MIDILILNGLSFFNGEKLLIEEGYIEENVIEKENDECDRLFLYPYSLYDENKMIMDRVFHAEYCNKDEDGDFVDFKCLWIRNNK